MNSVLIEMFVTSISFRMGPLNRIKSGPSLSFKSISAQSWYKLCTYGSINQAFKISLMRSFPKKKRKKVFCGSNLADFGPANNTASPPQRKLQH